VIVVKDSASVRTPANAKLSSVVEQLEAAYWVPLLQTPFAGLDEIERKSKTDCPQLHQSFSSFNANLRAAKDLLEFPYLLLAPLLPSVQNHSAILPDGMLDMDASELSDDQHLKMIEFVTSALNGSQDHLMKKKTELQRLLHQACLLIWGAIETYSKQVFTAALNERPSLFTAISKSADLKERFSIGNGAWFNLLQNHDFDLKGKLGTIIAANRDFSSPQLLRDLFPVMFADVGKLGFPIPEEGRDTLWKLGQRRHLIAHRCSIVDQDYLDKTNDEQQELGKLLYLRGRDVGKAMGAAASFAILVYGNARYCWRDDR